MAGADKTCPIERCLHVDLQAADSFLSEIREIGGVPQRFTERNVFGESRIERRPGHLWWEVISTAIEASRDPQ